MISGAFFIDDTKNKPFRSDDLKLVTMMMDIFHKSKQKFILFLIK